MAKITYTRGDGKGGTVTKTGTTSSATAKKLKARSSGGSSKTPYERGLEVLKADPAGIRGGAITPESVSKKVDAVKLPTPPVATTDFGSILNVNNAGLADTQGGLTYDGGQFNILPTDSEAVAAAKQANAGNAGVLNAVAQYLKPQDNQFEDAYAQTLKDTGLRQYEKQRDQYANQLNAIVANRDASKLKLEGQGRGQTQGFIGGEQARIDREAAIQALPIQAQLAAAQGAVDTAQKHLDTLFQVRSQDIQAQNTYKTNLANTVMQYASQAQQNILNAKISDIQTKNATAQANLAYQRQLQGMALEYGQNSLIGGISAIDPSSPDFENQIAAYTSQLRKPVAATTQKAPTLQNFGTSDNPIWKQYDYGTGEWLDVAGVAGASTPQQAQALMEAEKTFNTLNEVSNSKAVDSVVGTSIFTRGAGTTGGVMGRLLAGGAAGAATGATLGLVGGPLAPITSTIGAVGGGITGAILAAGQGSKDAMTGDRQKLIVDLDNIIANASFTKLSTEKNKGATFGALSEGEWEKIDQAATTLAGYRMQDGPIGDKQTIGYNTSEKNFHKEVDVLKYYTALDAMTKGASIDTLAGMNVRQQADGKYYYQNWDGTIVELKREY